MADRKFDHIDLAFKSQTSVNHVDNRFIYEPMLAPHPQELKPFQFLGKTIRTPIWASSMTGGTQMARTINHNIARVCKDFGMGMGLGSCRMLLNDSTHFEDFDVRRILGDEQPLYANLGIAQIETLVQDNKIDKIKHLLESLQADGLIVHVNPLQEWFQPEGNRITKSPIDIVEALAGKIDCSLIVKEVGQGIGNESLKQLLQLPIQAVEFGAFGGTNFSMVELLRGNEDQFDIYKPFANVGQTAEQMVDATNQIADTIDIKGKQLIISGGIKNFLDGYYFMQKSTLPSLYGQASTLLKYAKQGYEPLYHYIKTQVQGLKLAGAFLRINPEYL